MGIQGMSAGQTWVYYGQTWVYDGHTRVYVGIQGCTGLYEYLSKYTQKKTLQ